MMRTLLRAAAMALTLSTALSACSESTSPAPGESCPPGTADCPCAAGSGCGEGLICQDDLCVADACPAGSEGCGCFGNFTCADDLSCSAERICVAGSSCTPGAFGCPCDGGACDAEDAVCDPETDTCQRAGCPPGEAGCACGPQQLCGRDAEDQPLSCVAGLCQPAGCAPGGEGCVCRQGTDCDVGACVRGFCMAEDCVAGRAGCLCAGGTCDPGLRCQADTICVDNTGHAQGACFEDGTCTHGNRCSGAQCVACRLGSQGCHCRDDGACNDGLDCGEAGLCENARGLAEQAPATPKCFTPCQEGLTLADGTFVRCPADGLAPGCFGDTTCQHGQCLAPEAAPQTCASDVDCPDFQACLAGHCGSNCDTSEDCVEGAICHRHVCRQRCTVADEIGACGGGQHCALTDGENGVCRASVPAGGAEREPQAPFSVSSDALILGNASGLDHFVLTNHAPTPVRFTLTRRTHLIFEADGGQAEARFEPGCQAPDCPMWWVEVSVDAGPPSAAPVISFTLDGGASATVALDDGDGLDAPRWQGALEVATEGSGVRTIVISRSSTPTGQWTGEAYYFGNFKDVGLDTWMAAKDDPGAVQEVENAFVRLWANFRQGRLTFEQLQAALVSTRTESWRSQRLYALGCDPGSVCHPFDNFDGFLTYTTDPINVPVPSGVVEMPMAINLAPVGAEAGPRDFRGRVESPQALQYAGLPEIALRFASDPSGCDARGGEICLTFLEDFAAELAVGARYNTTSDDTECSGLATLQHARTPWLIEGFVDRSEQDEESGRRYTYSCLDAEAPLPMANPVPDGRLRYRTLELVDGALINDSTLFIIFRERLETFLWAEPNSDNGIEGYGYMILRKSQVELPAEDFSGQPAPRRDNVDRFLRPIECGDDLLAALDLDRRQLETEPARHVDRIAQAVIEGVTGDLDQLSVLAPEVEVAHALCEDNGLFDGGPLDDRAEGPVEAEPCPSGSRITFFTLSLVGEDAALLDDCQGMSLADCHQAFIAAQPCQADQSCDRQLRRWIDNERHGVRLDPYYRCEDPNRALCNDDRQDLTADKVFFAADAEVAVFRPLRTEVAEAFRYRTRFVNRSGANLGFVPEICAAEGDLIPYCYDPEAIEALRSRVECGVELYAEYGQDLSEARRLSLLSTLIEIFSSAEEVDAFNRVSVRRGFEFLDTELMIMLGDELYTRALASRFDLAQSRVAAFEGDLFEEGGIRLSGVAGAEMHNLYAAVQHYQVTLDRFYALAPLIAGSVKAEREQGIASFVTTGTVESYLGRLIRASTQKARAWADIAERYQNFNRADLARRVIERAYTASYLESMILTRLMQEIVDITAPEELDQIQQQIETAQRNYRVALSVMRKHYADITDDLNYFGFSPDFIPFPALEGFQDNSFEVARKRALERIELARNAETLALEADLSFNTNTASFQNELARIEHTYDAQLAELCGTFEAEDGRILPATPRYAHLRADTLAVGDPCGLVGTGQIHQAMIEVDEVLTEMRRVRQSIVNVQQEAALEQARWQTSCQRSNAFALLNFNVSGDINNVQQVIDSTRNVIAGLDRFLQEGVSIAQMTKCSVVVGTANGGDCLTAGIATSAVVAAFATYEAARVSFDVSLSAAEASIRELQRGIEFERDQLTCDLTAIDGQFRVRTILLRIAELRLEALKVEYQLSQAISAVQQQRNQATRLQQEQAETEALAINVEAARSNPNVRIYRNDAIINADVTFYSALREVYKATRVFEYYTSQSYAPLEQLFLTRMVARGDYNLQNYLVELEDAFRDFEDQYGLPSRRLQIISLKNDILAIPRIDVEGDGRALTDSERTALFRAALTDPRRLDESGYLTIPFSTSSDALSPLTRNHKIAHVEAEIIGGGQGDLLARVYLRMAGTARVAPLGQAEPIFYTFPERLAVINPFFAGSKPLHIDPEIYRNRNLVDRPLVNSRWAFVLNTLDEAVNQDLSLEGLDDVRLYVYYNDFTEF